MTHRPAVLLLGATGYLGPALRRAFADTDLTAGGTDVMDVSDAAAVAALVSGIRPAVVVNAAASTPARGMAALHAVNAVGAGTVAASAAHVGARLVHVSTDVVHDGSSAPYPDNAPARPLGQYGASKAAGEAAVRAAHPEAALVRSSLIWDPERIDPPTAGFAERLGAGHSLWLWEDAWRQPIHADDLAALVRVVALDAADVTGGVNAGGRQALTRLAFGRRLLAHFRVEGRERAHGRPAPAGVATDLRLRTDVADRLGVRLRGVDELLSDADRP